MKLKTKLKSNLNPKFTFENFIEGDYNRFARSVGCAIAEDPDETSFNPLFLHSPNGLGKTHLLHAIGNQIKENFPDKNVLYVSAEKFTQEYFEAIKSDIMNCFLEFYKNLVDVLILDDINKLSGQTGTQSELLSIFNHFLQNDKRIIFSSGKHPVDLTEIEIPLLNRFKSGIVAELATPSMETRVEILKNKIKNSKIKVAEDAIVCIAENVSTNIFELEGFLNTISATATFSKRAITLDLADEVLKKYCKKPGMKLIDEKSVLDVDNKEVFLKLIRRLHSIDYVMEDVIRIRRYGDRHGFTITKEEAKKLSDIILGMTENKG